MRIRELTTVDAQEFHGLRLRGLQESPAAFGASYAEERDMPLQAVVERMQSEGSHTFGAFTDEGQLVGMAGLYRERRPKFRHKAWVVGMYVTPEFRRQGIGWALLEAVVARAREMQGVRQVKLMVTAGNEAARRLYAACGFERFGLEKEALWVDGTPYDTEYMVLRVEDGGQ
jgi:RimJ/RimL family protein N-acetyltransferase